VLEEDPFHLAWVDFVAADVDVASFLASGDDDAAVGLQARIETQFGSGAHAFIVTGYAGDELTSVVAPFWVPRPEFRTADRSRQQG